MYGYDDGGRLTTISGWLDSGTYDRAGRPTELLFGNFSSRSYHYDDRGNVSLIDNAGQGDLPDYSLTWNQVGNLVGKNGSEYAYWPSNMLKEAVEDGLYKDQGLVRNPLYREADIRGAYDPTPLSDQLDSSRILLSFDGRAASIGADLKKDTYVYAVTLIPDDASAHVPALATDSVTLYAKGGELGQEWTRLDASITQDPATGRLSAVLPAPLRLRQIKLHCELDIRDINLEAPKALFTNYANGMLEVGYFADRLEQSYLYDAQGNRIQTSRKSGSQERGLSHDTATRDYEYWDNTDRIRFTSQVVIGDDGQTSTESWAYVYDPVGNLVEKGNAYSVSTDGAISFNATEGSYFRYQYDLWNRLSAVYRSEAGTDAATAPVSTYRYDPNGLRILKTTADTETLYTYGVDGTLLEETRMVLADPNQTVQLDFVHAFGTILAWQERSETTTRRYWAITDHLGSVSGASDESGTLVMRQDYDAFGNPHDALLPGLTGPRFTGKDWDEDAGLYYFNARWYDPELGRFITEDPIRDGVNWYGYVGNKPLSHIDLDGKQERTIRGLVIDGVSVGVVVTGFLFANVALDHIATNVQDSRGRSGRKRQLPWKPGPGEKPPKGNQAEPPVGKGSNKGSPIDPGSFNGIGGDGWKPPKFINPKHVWTVIPFVTSLIYDSETKHYESLKADKEKHKPKDSGSGEVYIGPTRSDGSSEDVARLARSPARISHCMAE